MAKQVNDLPFYQRLVLNQFVIRQFGAFSFTELKKPFSNSALEEIQANGETGFVQALLLHFKKTAFIAENKLLLYDAHIVQHLAKINAHRDEKIRLKYFQWLSLMFVEYYLERYFNGGVFYQNKSKTYTIPEDKIPPEFLIPSSTEIPSTSSIHLYSSGISMTSSIANFSSGTVTISFGR